MEQTDLEEELKYIRGEEGANLEVRVVQADPSKGFSYPYLLVAPRSRMRNTLVMNCLNDYEEPMEQGTTENQQAINEVFDQFGDDWIRASETLTTNNEPQEDFETTKQRVATRLAGGLKHLSKLINKAGFGQVSMPIIMPLIPGYTDDLLHHTASELSIDFAGDIDGQVLEMIEDAKRIIKKETGIAMDDQIISYGHSKSAIFARNFATLHPEMVSGLIIGGVEEIPLPIDEVRLRVKESVVENEQFEIIDGIVYKSITQEELDRIISEYSTSRMKHQRDIQIGEDGSYILPLNYPIGVADIDHYIDLSTFPNGKEGYREALSKIPRMLFVGEREEEVEGHFSYTSGVTSEGIEYGYAEDIDYLTHDGRRAPDLHEVEKASMHNRILEYRAATLALFGRGANERLRNYVQLSKMLGMDVQSKIYERVGHRDIYDYRPLSDDTTKIIVSYAQHHGNPQLGDEGRVERIDQIYQLFRRASIRDGNGPNAFASKLPKRPEAPHREDYASKGDYEKARHQYELALEKYNLILWYMKQGIDFYISKTRKINADTNMDRMYDSLTPEEIRMVLNDRVIQRIREVVSRSKLHHATDAPER